MESTGDSTVKQIFEQELKKNSVFKDRNLISPHYIPKVLPFREPQIREIGSMLAVTISGKKPNNIFAYGTTGSGKTSVTKQVLSELISFAREKNAAVDGAYINCRNHNSKYRVIIKCVKDFYPEQNFLGFSFGFIYDKLLDYANTGKQIVIVLDEIDKVKDLDELVYSITRANDELSKGSITLIGISNNLMFKDKLDRRTKSSLCQHEMVFLPYNAEELQEIITQRANLAFQDGAVLPSAINLAAAYAAHESGDARTAIMLILKAGELADKKNLDKVSDVEVERAKKKVEEEITFNMISSLPRQQQLVLYTIACLTFDKKGAKRIGGEYEPILFSGEIYDEYTKIAKKLKENVVSSRWYREYISELEMYGLIVTTASGKGIRGSTRLITLGFDAKKIKDAIEKELVQN